MLLLLFQITQPPVEVSLIFVHIVLFPLAQCGKQKKNSATRDVMLQWPKEQFLPSNKKIFVTVKFLYFHTVALIHVCSVIDLI